MQTVGPKVRSGNGRPLIAMHCLLLMLVSDQHATLHCKLLLFWLDVNFWTVDIALTSITQKT